MSVSTIIPQAPSKGVSSAATSSSKGMNLTASDFISMMVTQLQNQDPLQPTDSSQLLSQMSQIGQLQSSTQLQQTLSSIMLQSQLSSAGGLIGKSVQGLDSQGNTLKGVVTSVTAKSDGIYVNLDTNKQLSLSQVTQINGNASTTPTATAGTGA